MSDRAVFQKNQIKATDRAVGVQLQSLRIFAGLTADQTAARLCISRVVLERIESGAVRPAPVSLLAMASLYGVPPSRIFAVVQPA